ncbi:MAG: MBOAT family protein [Clostridia bacterium]|nr:MBOAT family protein [Clostridia bacterium]
MSFTSLTFLLFFLPCVLFLYRVSPPRLQNLVLLFSSLVFYALGELSYLWLLLFTAVLQYLAARLMARYPHRKRLILIVAVSVSLLFLFYYKYASFFLSFVGVSFSVRELPVGISFYTFQAISYTVDVYRGEVRAQRSFSLFATYLTLFPQLVAGPIVRYSEVEEALLDRSVHLTEVAEGAFRFAVGLSKKLILADSLAAVATAYGESTPTVLLGWLTAIAFTLQIYFDFSGYSDMAVGLGKLFGFDFPENFNYPYIARSITEFWRRWHITLSSFFKSYVYIPLGGNRRGRWRTYFNLAIVWLLTGLWHGAAFTFLAWGLMYAVLLIFEKATKLSLPSIVGHLYTFLFTVIGFVFFSAPSLSDAFSKLSAMFFFAPLSDAASRLLLFDVLPMLLLALIFATPFPKTLIRYLTKREASRSLMKALATPALLVLSLAFLAGASTHPFLYFRF